MGLKPITALLAKPSGIGSRINQVQALGSLGLYHRAAQILDDVEGQLQALPDSAIKANALLNLGNLLRLRGELDRSHDQLIQGLDLAKSLDLQPMTGQLFLSLGNTERIFAAQAIAYALGTAETWHETQQDWDTAKQVTNAALQKAQSIRASDMAY
ncbi:MAG: hypothetical protein WBA10_04365 [Elainellaceae cyanobacterium]